MIRIARFVAVSFCCVILCFLSPVVAQSQNWSSPADLVRMVSQRELAALNDSSHFHYFDRRQTSEGHTATYGVVETGAGSVEWRVAVDDKPLDSGQKHAEEEWLDKLLAHPEIQHDRQQEEQREIGRRRNLLQVLPQAFLYEKEAAGHQAGIVRLHFRPNPDFHPSTREAQVLRGMEGTLWVNTAALRFVKAQGSLVHDVSFGWGILGHLDQGGKFSLEETQVASGIWRITDLHLGFDGKVLLFKSIQLRVQTHSYDYSRVADHLSLQEGINLLRQQKSSDAPEPDTR
jgi:hypothetical protein